MAAPLRAARPLALFPKDRNLARPPERVEIPVRASDFRLPAGELSIRLDAFLQHHLPWRSRTSIQELITDGYVALALPAPERPDGPTALEAARRPGRRLRHGATVVVTIPEELRLAATTDTGADLAVLYEDEHLIAVDKPPLLPVHPSGRHLADTLIQRLHARAHGEELAGRVRFAVRLCHRLDRETSGIVLCAKDREAHAKLMRAFERRRVEKEYLAIVHGRPDGAEGLVDLPLGPARRSSVHLKMAVVEGGLPSQTRWRLREGRGPFSLLSCLPLTGRQHQIRVHLEAIGHPLVGDKLYGVDEALFLRDLHDELRPDDHAHLRLARHALHHHRLVVPSPRDGRPLEVTSPLPPDLRSFLDEQAS